MSRFFKKRPSPPPLPFCSAVVAAAGHSTRMEGKDKIFELLDGMPVLAHTLLALEHCPAVHEIIVVTKQESLLLAGQLCKTYGISKATQIIIGGNTRVESVFLGLRSVAPEADFIAIQDGARPFITPDLVAAVIQKASVCGAAAPAISVHDTIKTISKDLFTGTPDRNTLAAVQTPQVFEALLIKGAIQRALEEQWPITDDCSAVERLGMQVSFVNGLPENIKITTRADLAMAEGICTWRREEQFS